MQIIKKFNRTTCLTVALLALGLAGCAHHPDRTASQYWSDKMTSRHVKSALNNAPTYKYSDVSVATMDGTVSLNGFVNTEDQKKAAGQIAQNVQGVRQVIDNLVIRPLPTGRPPVIEHPKELKPEWPPSTTPNTEPTPDPQDP